MYNISGRCWGLSPLQVHISGLLLFIITGHGPRLILSDSICKYITARETDVKFFKGRTVREISDMIFFNKVDVTGYSIICVHAGTNDINQLIESGNIANTSIHDVMGYYSALRANIRRRNTFALILFSSVLPRADKFYQYLPLIRGLNFAIEKMCSKSKGASIYIPSYKWFIQRGNPVKALYAQDGLHPNGAGNDTLQAGLQQMMSTAALIERVTSRRTARLAALPY